MKIGMKQSELEQILAQHKIWLNSNKVEGKQADLSCIDLRGAKLAGADLRQAKLVHTDFRGADLRTVNMEKAKLETANFEKADLRNATLRGAKLGRTRMIRSDLRRVNFEAADLKEADFMEAVMLEAKMEKTDCAGTNLEKAIMTRVNLSGANLSFANLRRGNLNESVLNQVRLYETNFHNANLQQANLSNINLKGGQWEGCNLTGVTIFENSVMDFSEVILQRYQNTFQLLRPPTQPIKSKIRRTLEFPPEYHMIGLAILTYFGAIMRHKHPGKKSVLKVEQDELKIILTIESNELDQDVIEQTMDEYALVILGKLEPEKFLTDKLQVLELKHQLELFRMELQRKQEMFQFAQLHFLKNQVKAVLPKMEIAELTLKISQVFYLTAARYEDFSAKTLKTA